IPEERLVHNYLIEAGLAGRIPKGVRIWEETLRDGEQTPGVAYTPEEKIQIARFLDEIHVPIMDVGIPVVSKEEARGVRACTNAGAHRAVVCDTVGVMTPPGIRWFFGQLKERLVPTELSFHGHNDFGLAVANSLAAVEEGVQVPHTCVNGLGERSGNASFEE